MRLSKALDKSKSSIVREAVVEYEARSDRRTGKERQEQLAALAAFKKTPLNGDEAQVSAELAELRTTRRASGRRE